MHPFKCNQIWPHLSEKCPQKVEHLNDEFPTLINFCIVEVVGANERTSSNSGHHTLLEPLQTCQQRHMGFVHCCAYERGNGVVATGGGDGRIFFWTEQHQVWKGGSMRSGQKRVKHLGKLTGGAWGSLNKRGWVEQLWSEHLLHHVFLPTFPPG